MLTQTAVSSSFDGGRTQPDPADQPGAVGEDELAAFLHSRLEACGELDWWLRPPWNKDKDRRSVLDAERLML